MNRKLRKQYDEQEQFLYGLAFIIVGFIAFVIWLSMVV